MPGGSAETRRICFITHMNCVSNSSKFWVGSGSSSDPDPNLCCGSYPTKPRTIEIGPVLPPTTWHSNITSFAAIKNLGSNRIMTWSTCKLCSILRTFRSRFQICDKKPANFACYLGVISQRFYKYWSDCKVEIVRWKSKQNYTIYI